MINELYDENIDDAEIGPALDEPTGMEVADVRQLMIRAAQIERQISEVKRVRTAVLDRYDLRVGELERGLQKFRAAIEAWLIGVNGGRRVRFEDVGTAYLARSGGGFRVADAVALEDWAVASGLTKTVADMDAAKREAKAALERDGELAPGCEVADVVQSLRIKTT